MTDWTFVIFAAGEVVLLIAGLVCRKCLVNQVKSSHLECMGEILMHCDSYRKLESLWVLESRIAGGSNIAAA